MSGDQRYWDSDCFLGWLLAEPDKEAHCESVLEQAHDGKITIVTSALTIAEVLMLRGRIPVPKTQRTKVEQFFKSDYIVVRNITRRIAEQGRSLVWDAKIAPKDALHVATAMDAKLALFNTFDEKLIRKCTRSPDINLVVERPSVIEPTLPWSKVT